MVLLEHTLPDGMSHYDWMFERPGEEGGLLVSFRVQARPDTAGVGVELEAVRTGDHRSLYLEFEGEVSGGRGWVRRIGTGELRSITETGLQMQLVVRWDGGSGEQVWNGTADLGAGWRVARDA